jgi:hypothetical protein
MTEPRTLDIKTARVFKPLLAPARYKGAYGGRISGKSHFFAECAIERCVSGPSRIVCIREVQNSLKDSVPSAAGGQDPGHAAWQILRRDPGGRSGFLLRNRS